MVRRGNVSPSRDNVVKRDKKGAQVTAVEQEDSEAHRRLHRRLRRALIGLQRTEWGTWTTLSNLPHEIRLHRQAGTDYVRVSAGMVVGVRTTKALLADVNMLNTERAFARRLVGEGKIIVVAEMPFASLRAADLDSLVSLVLCFARLDAAFLARHGGRPVTEPPEALEPDVERSLESWHDVLEASGTATHREFNVWMDAWSGIDCWLDRDEWSLPVVLDSIGQPNEYPFRLVDLKESLESLQEQADDEDEAD